MGFDEIKKNLWDIVDDKRTKDRMRLKALKQLTEVTVQSLELIPMAEILNRIEIMNKDLMDRYAFVLEQEKSLVSHKNNSNESSKSKSSSDDDNNVGN